jgi:hypothetical protein
MLPENEAARLVVNRLQNSLFKDNSSLSRKVLSNQKNFFSFSAGRQDLTNQHQLILNLENLARVARLRRSAVVTDNYFSEHPNRKLNKKPK